MVYVFVCCVVKLFDKWVVMLFISYDKPTVFSILVFKLLSIVLNTQFVFLEHSPYSMNIIYLIFYPFLLIFSPIP